ncbi:hypothetical protein V1498_08960 [Peribacillus sp. SCS-26]|uniref:hypothetical protein n=1 Tax=Paraperibacillus marinus TaxID=3115295 RepID=UPI0039069DD4
MTKGQENLDQYKMPDVLKEKRKSAYRVGYTATTGNATGGNDEPGKRSDWPN